MRETLLTIIKTNKYFGKVPYRMYELLELSVTCNGRINPATEGIDPCENTSFKRIAKLVSKGSDALKDPFIIMVLTEQWTSTIARARSLSHSSGTQLKHGVNPRVGTCISWPKRQWDFLENERSEFYRTWRRMAPTWKNSFKNIMENPVPLL